jgi:hypothetical protein
MPFIASTIMKQPPGRYADGNGLYLEVKPAGGARKSIGRYWMFRYRDNGEMRWKSLGVYRASRSPWRARRRGPGAWSCTMGGIR